MAESPRMKLADCTEEDQPGVSRSLRRHVQLTGLPARLKSNHHSTYRKTPRKSSSTHLAGISDSFSTPCCKMPTRWTAYSLHHGRSNHAATLNFSTTSTKPAASTRSIHLDTPRIARLTSPRDAKTRPHNGPPMHDRLCFARGNFDD